MFSLGCIQALRCHTNTCPTGITTHNPRLQRGLVVEEKWQRVANYANGMNHDIEMIAHSCGVEHPRLLRREHCRIVQANGHSTPSRPVSVSAAQGHARGGLRGKAGMTMAFQAQSFRPTGPPTHPVGYRAADAILVATRPSSCSGRRAAVSGSGAFFHRLQPWFPRAPRRYRFGRQERCWATPSAHDLGGRLARRQPARASSSADPRVALLARARLVHDRVLGVRWWRWAVGALGRLVEAQHRPDRRDERVILKGAILPAATRGRAMSVTRTWLPTINGSFGRGCSLRIWKPSVGQLTSSSTSSK